MPLVIGCHLAGLMILKAPDFFGNGEIKQLPAIDAVILGSLAFVIDCMLLARTIVRYVCMLPSYDGQQYNAVRERMTHTCWKMSELHTAHLSCSSFLQCSQDTTHIDGHRLLPYKFCSCS